MLYNRQSPVRVTLVATPLTQIAPLSGLYETFNGFAMLSRIAPDIPSHPFDVEVVAPHEGTIDEGELSLGTRRHFDDVDDTDIAIIPLMMVEHDEWRTGRFPSLVRWLRTLHARGTTVCSTCTGALLLAETGLLDGADATIHWAFAPTFRRNFPEVRLRTEQALVTAGARGELVMTGGVMSWHDLALHLIAEHVGPTAAQEMARFLMLEWHAEGQSPYVSFAPRFDHDDAEIAELQRWLGEHFATANPVEELVARSTLPRRSLERRFRAATAESPISYVQQLRVAEARRRLERSDDAVERIAFDVGYENTAFFRRVFKRTTQMNPSAYRRKFRVPLASTRSS